MIIVVERKLTLFSSIQYIAPYLLFSVFYIIVFISNPQITQQEDMYIIRVESLVNYWDWLAVAAVSHR